MKLLLITVSVALLVGSCTGGFLPHHHSLDGDFSSEVHGVSGGYVSSGIAHGHAGRGYGSVIVPGEGRFIGSRTISGGYSSGHHHGGVHHGHVSRPVVSVTSHGRGYGYGK